MADDDESTCWICLAGAEDEPHHHHHHDEEDDDDDESAHHHARRPQQRAPALGPLLQVCACPRRVHASCCARWQLHSAGKR
jgi:hypothetical protein